MEGFVVYMHTNKINGKKYIGITCQDSERRWRPDGDGYKNNCYFYNAIKKHGWDNFESAVLMSGLSKEQAEAEEVRLIALYDTTNRIKGYNNAHGGGANGFHTEETKKKMSEVTRQRPVNWDKIRKMQELNTGKKAGRETRKKISDALTGKKLSPEHCKNISESHKGYVMPEAQKKKIRESCIAALSSPEARKRISNTSKSNTVIIEHLRKMATGRMQYNEPVVLTNTGEQFENHAVAAKKFGMQTDKALKSCLKVTLSAGKGKNGKPLVWRFLREYDPDFDYQKEYGERRILLNAAAANKRWASRRGEEV